MRENSSQTSIYLRHFCIILFSITSFSTALSQPIDTLEIQNLLWPSIEKSLTQNNGITSYKNLTKTLDNFCITRNLPQVEVYETAMFKLEAEFNLLAATAVGESLVQKTINEKLTEREAHTRLSLHRYYSAIGDHEKAVGHLDKALFLYQKTGNSYKVLHCKIYILLDSRSFRSDESILEDFNALLAKSEQENDTAAQKLLNHNMAQINLENGFIKEAEENIASLEKFAIQDSISCQETTSAMHTSLYRANLELAKNDTVKAIFNYNKTLKLSRAEPDHWVEIHVMQTLASIYLNTKNIKTAKLYLREAHEKALNLDALDLTATNYLFESILAEKEKRFEDAYIFVNKYHYYTNLQEQRNNGFNLHSHYLTLEKEQLANEKRQKELEISIQKSQLKYTSVIFIFTLISSILFFIAFRKHKKGNMQLALQNEVIKQQTLELKEMDQAKSRFFANISHELRTPLTLLTSPIKSLLTNETLTKQQKKLLNIANESGKQLEDLINEILDLRKLESGKMQLNLNPTNLSSFCQNYVSQFESLANQKSIVYTYQNEFDPGIFANIDREKWRQVMLNLLSNAFKFTPAGETIHVISRLKNETIEFIVSDTGEGVHAEDLPKLFNLYYQSEKSNVNTSGGTGIGLTLCHEYAQLFKGSLKATSKLGRGFEIKLSVPYLKANLKPEEIEPNDEQIENHESEIGFEPTNRRQTAKPTLLLVEDNLSLQKYISLFLADAYTILIANNGKDALTQLSTEQHVDLIISDLMMPVMDGYGLVDALKKNSKTSSIPIIMLTARTEIETKLKALRFGIDDYITKPFDERELIVRIENLLNNQTVRTSSKSNEGLSDSKFTKGERAWVERFEAFTKTNLSDTSLNIPTLAAEFAMSESSLLRKVKHLIGITPSQYIQEMRLDEARKMLEERTFSTLKELAYKTGYKDERTFSRGYKKRFGKSPSGY